MMDQYTATEQAYKHGYEKGYEAGKKDAMKWISVTERLPRKNMKCLCRYVFGDNYDYPFEQVFYYIATCEEPHFQNEGSLGMKVTHWMPLPEPPKEGE